MNNIAGKAIFVICLMSFLCSGCRYPEYSWSLDHPEDRIIGIWQLQNIKKNGEDMPDSETRAALCRDAYYRFEYANILIVTVYDENLSPTQSVKGSYVFFDNYKKLNIDFRLQNKEYQYEARIIKFSDHQLKYTYTDSQGDNITLDFYQ
ncbi:MAG: hypothetical protein LBR51_01405 [Bacteroidales bacterium]|jgi:hypothetical protein|nr:hypothetical protein [Bacteroidales bacterium]